MCIRDRAINTAIFTTNTINIRMMEQKGLSLTIIFTTILQLRTHMCTGRIYIIDISIELNSEKERASELCICSEHPSMKLVGTGLFFSSHAISKSQRSRSVAHRSILFQILID